MKLYIEKSGIKNLKVLLLFHGLLYYMYLLDKNNKKWGTQDFFFFQGSTIYPYSYIFEDNSI